MTRSGPLKQSDTVAYAGYSADKQASLDRLYPGGILDQMNRPLSQNEQLYLDSLGTLRINQNYQALADVGTPALYVMSGSLGAGIRLLAAESGALQIAYGGVQAYNGDAWAAAGNIVMGALNVAGSGAAGGLRGGVVGSGAKGLAPSRIPFNEQNFTLNGQAQFVESRFIQSNTTVRLSEDFTLNTGVVVPKGSIVTVSDDVMKIVEPNGVSSIKSYDKNVGQPLMLTDSGAKTFTLDNIRNLSGREKWEAGETYIQELYGSTGQRYYPVPGTGGRYVDAPVDMPNGTVSANEVKTYQRIISSTGKLNEVPVSEKIYAQIEKDLYLRDTVKGYEPKWIFLEAPPAKELSRILELNKIDVIIHK